MRIKEELRAWIQNVMETPELGRAIQRVLFLCLGSCFWDMIYNIERIFLESKYKVAPGRLLN
jgi:hypothetical protein